MLENLENMHPSKVRTLIWQNELVRPTSGMASGFTQANLAMQNQN